MGMRSCIISFVIFTTFLPVFAASDDTPNQNKNRFETNQTIQRQTPKTDFGTVLKTTSSKQTANKTLKPAYSPQMYQNQRNRLLQVKNIVRKYSRCRDFQSTGKQILDVAAQLGKYDTLLANKSTLQNTQNLMILKQSRTAIVEKLNRIKNVRFKEEPADYKCWSKMKTSKTDSPDLNTLDEAKKNYNDAKEQFKLAMRILLEHAERQTQAVQRVTS